MRISSIIALASIVAGLYLLNENVWLSFACAIIGFLAIVVEVLIPQPWKDRLTRFWSMVEEGDRRIK